MRTARLLLRRWRPEDKSAFAALNEDTEVMRYMPRSLTRSESDQWAENIEREFERDGFGLWALELPGEMSFIGFTGLNRVPFDAHFTPAIEIGWRLARDFWGYGYATEAAQAAVQMGFQEFGLKQIIAETAEANSPSRRVMSRIGMSHDNTENFRHPAYCSKDALGNYVLYRLSTTQNPSQPTGYGQTGKSTVTNG